MSGLFLPLVLAHCALMPVFDGALLNPVKLSTDETVRESTRILHRQLLVADLHADTLLFDRGGVKGIQRRHSYGHADLPRMREGNVGFQVLTVPTITPVPYCQHLNGGWLFPDGQWIHSPVQGWPPRTWFNSKGHALYQAYKWRVNADGVAFAPIRSKNDLHQFMHTHYQRSGGAWVPRDPQHQPVATVLGLEGSHALQIRDDHTDEEIATRVREFREAGFRMLALTHRFNNDLGGASEGSSPRGVTPLGHRLLTEMQRQGLICDLAHASSATIDDVLTHHPRLPVLVSHGGIAFPPLVGGQVADRQLSVAQARLIARRGGIIGIGLWPEAVGYADPRFTAAMIQRCIADPQIGASHVALGSDMDGVVLAAFAANHWALLTEELRDLPEATLRKVMGGNVIRFFQAHLPEK